MLFVRGDPERSASQKTSSRKRTDTSVHTDEPVAIISQDLDADQTFRYSEASGDKVKIHLDAEVARKAGFKGIIGHGLCTLAFTSRAIVNGVAGDNPERLKRLAVRFAKPVIPGETLRTSIWPASGGRPGDYVFETRDPRDSLVISDGRAELAPEC